MINNMISPSYYALTLCAKSQRWKETMRGGMGKVKGEIT